MAYLYLLSDPLPLERDVIFECPLNTKKRTPFSLLHFGRHKILGGMSTPAPYTRSLLCLSDIMLSCASLLGNRLIGRHQLSDQLLLVLISTLPSVLTDI